MNNKLVNKIANELDETQAIEFWKELYSLNKEHNKKRARSLFHILPIPLNTKCEYLSNFKMLGLVSVKKGKVYLTAKGITLLQGELGVIVEALNNKGYIDRYEERINASQRLTAMLDNNHLHELPSHDGLVVDGYLKKYLYDTFESYKKINSLI